MKEKVKTFFSIRCGPDIKPGLFKLSLVDKENNRIVLDDKYGSHVQKGPKPRMRKIFPARGKC